MQYKVYYNLESNAIKNIEICPKARLTFKIHGVPINMRINSDDFLNETPCR